MTALEPPRLQQPLGPADDPGSVFGFALAGPTLLAIHYGKNGWGRLHRLHPKTLARVAEPIRVGHEPRAVAWHPGRDEAYVMNRGKDSYSLTRCSLATGQTTDIPIGFGLIHMAVDPVADRIYTADWAHRRIFVIEAADPTQRHAIELPGPPVQLAVAPDGDVYATLSLKGGDPNIDALAVIRPDGSVHSAPMEPAHLQPGAVAVGHDGMIYVGSLGGGTVHPLVGIHDPDTCERLGSVRPARGVRAIAAHPHLSRAWAATDDGAQMADLSNPYSPQVLDVVPTGPAPYSVLVADDGTVYVGDVAEGTVSLLEQDLSDVPLEAVSTLLTEAGHPIGGGLAKALRSYQKFHELPLTGLPDTTTVGHLTAPGCGTPDRVVTATYNLYSGHYRHTDLTYYLGDMNMPNGNPALTHELKLELLKTSFHEWVKILSENFTPVIDFVQVFDPAEADLVISVGDDPIFHDTGWFRTVYAVTNFPGNPWPKERAQLPIIFNEAVPWHAPGYIDLPPLGLGVDFRHVATHELGHALGLDHGSKNSLMAKNATWYRVPKGDDQDGLRAVFGRMPFSSARGLEVLPGVDHVTYQDCERHHIVHFKNGADWTFTRLDVDLGARRPAKGFSADPHVAVDGAPAYVYKGDDDHVHQYRFTGGAWQWADLTDDSGGPPPAETGPKPYRNGKTQRVVYGATDGRIIRLSQPPGQGWTWEDVSQEGAGVPMDSSPFGYVDGNTGFDVIAYRDDGQGLRLLQEGPAGWSHISVSWATEQENPTLLESLLFTGLAPAGAPHRLFAIDHRLDVRMFWFGTDGAWHTRSLTAELGLPEASSIALAPSGPSWTLVVAGYVDGLLRELTSKDGEAWAVRPIEGDDLPLADLHGVSAWSGQADRQISYLARNGNLILLTRPLTDPGTGPWKATNLTRRTGVL